MNGEVRAINPTWDEPATVTFPFTDTFSQYISDKGSTVSAIAWLGALDEDGALPIHVLFQVLSELESLNESSARSRSLSLAITKVEEAIHWLEAA